MIVILHNIRSLHNVGSIFRTADAVGADKIYLSGITPAPVDRFGDSRGKLAKTALGAEVSVAWEKVPSTARLIKSLKKERYEVVAVEQAKTSVPYYRFSQKKNKKTALVLGAEVTGIPASILRLCDTIIEIPMHGKKESLNVSVAFGVVAFHLRDN